MLHCICMWCHRRWYIIGQFWSWLLWFKQWLGICRLRMSDKMQKRRRYRRDKIVYYKLPLSCWFVFIDIEDFHVWLLTVALAIYLFPESLLLSYSVIFPENLLQNQGHVLQSVASYNQGNMVAPRLDKKVLYFVGPKGSLQSRQETITFPHPEPDESRSTKVLIYFSFCLSWKHVS